MDIAQGSPMSQSRYKVPNVTKVYAAGQDRRTLGRSENHDGLSPTGGVCSDIGGLAWNHPVWSHWVLMRIADFIYLIWLAE